MAGSQFRRTTVLKGCGRVNKKKIVMNAVKRCVDTSSGGYGHHFISFMYLDNYLRSTNNLRIRIARVEIC